VERGLREAFTVTEEWTFPGVKVLRVRKEAALQDGASVAG
jgi:hypothetical protein